jgi:hypothetical protein
MGAPDGPLPRKFLPPPRESPVSAPIVLVLNDRCSGRAVAAGARYIRLVVASTDTMNRKNANALPEETMAPIARSSNAPRATGSN